MHFVAILIDLDRATRRLALRTRIQFWTITLALIAFPLFLVSTTVYSTACPAPKQRDARGDVSVLSAAVFQFTLQHDRCPTDIHELVDRGIITRDRVDPWRRAYVLLCEDDGSLIQVCSRGPDPDETRDDLCDIMP